MALPFRGLVGPPAAPVGALGAPMRHDGQALHRLLRRPVQVGLAAVATVLVTTLALTVLVLAVLAPRVSQADDALSALQDGHVAMVNQETGLRGFLITRERRFLQPYEAGVLELSRQDVRLRALAEYDAQLTDWVGRLQAAEQRWIDAFALPILQNQPALGASAELSAVLTAEKEDFDAYRAVQAEVRAGRRASVSSINASRPATSPSSGSSVCSCRVSRIASPLSSTRCSDEPELAV